MPITRVTSFGVNAYLVEEEDGLTLVDTMLPFTTKKILQAARATGKPVKRIALTHGHGDHVGGLDKLVAELGDVEVIISGRDAKLLRKDTSPEPGEPADAKLKGSVPGTKTQATRLVEDGDTIGSLQVVASPGHTPGHVAFFDPRDGTLIAGDAYSTIGGVATAARLKAPFPVIALVAWHRASGLESAQRLRDLDPSSLAVGHGKVVRSPTAEMDKALAHARG